MAGGAPCGGVLLAALVVGCAAFGSTPTPSGADAGGAPPDAAVGGGDAAAGVNLRGCPVVATLDFESPALPPEGWSVVGDVAVVPKPHRGSFGLASTATGGASAFVSKVLSEPSIFPSCLEIDVYLFPTSRAPFDGPAIFAAGDDARYSIIVISAGYERAILQQADESATRSKIDIGPIPIGAWSHVVLSFGGATETRVRASVTPDGGAEAAIATELVVDLRNPAFRSLSARGGMSYAAEATTTYTDDLTVAFKP